MTPQVSNFDGDDQCVSLWIVYYISQMPTAKQRAFLPMLAVVLTIPAPLAAQTTPITVVHAFPGMNGPNPADAGSASADMMGGVSRDFLVGFINGGLSVRSKQDGHEVQPPQTQMQFWSAAFRNAGGEVAGKPYDPRIAFDPMTSRWFAVADTNINGITNRVLIAVSQDADPTHTWKAVEYRMPTPIDNVKLGIDRFGLYTVGATGSPGPEAVPVTIAAIPKEDLLWKSSGIPSLARLNLLRVEGAVPRMSDRKYNGTEGMLPAYDLNPKKKLGDPVYFVNRFRTEVDGETIIQLRRLTWTAPGKATLSEPTNFGLGVHYTVQPTTLGIQPPLPAGLLSPGIRAGEARIVNAVVHSGSLWTIAGAEVNNRTGAFWVQIDLRSMKLVQHGTLADPNGDILFPSLNVDANGNLGIGMSRTSIEEHPSIYVTGRLASDPPNTLRPLVRAVQGHYVHLRKESDLTKPGQNLAWSDYSTVVMDPSDPTLFWTYQEATTNETMPKEENGDKFGTHWVAWRVGAPAKGSRVAKE